METRNQDSNPRKNDTNADYNPTARNFDHTNVSGKPDSMGGDSGRSRDEDIEDTDPPLTEIDLEETGLSDDEADQIEWDEPGQSGGESGGRAREQDGPVK